MAKMILKLVYSLIVISLCMLALYFIWIKDFNIYQWLKQLAVANRFLLSAIILTIIVVLGIWGHRENFKNLTFFLFSPSKFISQSVEDSIHRDIQDDPNLKERMESDENYRKARVEETEKNFSKSTNELRSSICHAFTTVFLVTICSMLSAFILVNYIFISHKQIVLIQIISSFLILWALIGKLGWSIQTFSGNTIPEQSNNFWFIFLNVVGSFSLFFTYFFGLFKR